MEAAVTRTTEIAGASGEKEKWRAETERGFGSSWLPIDVDARVIDLLFNLRRNETYHRNWVVVFKLLHASAWFVCAVGSGGGAFVMKLIVDHLSATAVVAIAAAGVFAGGTAFHGMMMVIGEWKKRARFHADEAQRYSGWISKLEERPQDARNVSRIERAMKKDWAVQPRMYVLFYGAEVLAYNGTVKKLYDRSMWPEHLIKLTMIERAFAYILPFSYDRFAERVAI
jgi:hypothetical protein